MVCLSFSILNKSLSVSNIFYLTRENIHSYTTEVSKLDQLVTRMLFESYGVEKYYDSHIGSTSYLLRFNGYRVPQDNEKNLLGAMPHTDASFTSILQQNEVQGLEVQSRDGAWNSVDFPSSSFVVMAGDALLVSQFVPFLVEQKLGA